jgi:hypothetical protein
VVKKGGGVSMVEVLGWNEDQTVAAARKIQVLEYQQLEGQMLQPLFKSLFKTSLRH